MTMTSTAQKIVAELDRLAASAAARNQTTMPGNTVEDVAATLGLDQGQMEAAAEELERAGIAHCGMLWSTWGDHRDIVALGAAHYGPR